MHQVQPSLFEAIAATGSGDTLPVAARAFSEVEHLDLGRGAWLEYLPGWMPRPTPLFERLLDNVAWRSERRPMYERVVDVPRLVSFYDEGDDLPDPAVEELRRLLNERYERIVGEPLSSVGLCCYRDGNDSVAWHGDRIGRGSHLDTVVAIVSLGARRRMLVRPRGGGRSRRYELGGGDLFVMGGSCQRTFDHAIPKTARPVGTRISLQFRTRGVR
jgi:alkylated DNA repair dioxygenase AlkB